MEATCVWLLSTNMDVTSNVSTLHC